MKTAHLSLWILLGSLTTPQFAQAEGEATMTFKTLTPAAALTVAQAALKNCSDAGYQIAVSVVDRAGVPQVMLRDRFAGPHTPETAERKAWTAVSFKQETSVLAEVVPQGEAWAMQHVTRALPLGGGVRILDGEGSLLGGVGVSGAPGGTLDEDCAKAGIAAIEDDIAF